MDKYQILPGGDRLFYKLPLAHVPEGYTQEPFNPNVFRLNYVPCIHRQHDKTIILPCKKTKQIVYCKVKDSQVDALICKSCTLSKD